MPKLIQKLFLSIMFVLLVACGGGDGSSDSGDPPSKQDIAIQTIETFVESGGVAPTVQDYNDAGVSGVNTTNLDQINAIIASLTPADVDTPSEIQALVDSMGVNLIPVAEDQNITVIQDTTNNAITLTGSDVDDGSLTYSVTTEPANGALKGSGANRTYTPNPAYAGSDSFQFIVNDGTDNSSPATVSITVSAIISGNDAPMANIVNITDTNGGQAEVGDELTGSYTYQDAEGDVEGASGYRWLRNGAVITGANALSYTLIAADGGKQIRFEVTPVAQTGTQTGLAVLSNTITVIFPLTVDSHSPIAGRTDVSRAANISIVFNSPLDASTVNASSVSLSKSAVSVATTISVTNNTVTVSPGALLDAMAVYSVTLTTDIQNTDGQLLATAVSWTFTTGNSTSVGPVNYDIVYVRFPITTGPQGPGESAGTVGIPAGETAYTLQPGADLMLLKPDGTETVLVNCVDTCSAMDPFISHDGKTVYYSYNKPSDIDYGAFSDNWTSWIYKIHLETHPDFNNFLPIRLTFNDGYDSVQYKANRDINGVIKAGHDQSSWRAIRDMAPAPLADGRLVFTSNRSALTAFHPGTNAVSNGSIQQLYVMDDHDGTANTKELSNLHLLETGNIHLVQHPMQLKDGRILFSTWQDAGTKTDISAALYAMTSLFTVHPDGSNLQQFTEPHDHHKNVEHFISQLSDEQVVWAQYYPHLEGFGVILRAPVSMTGQDFVRGSVTQTLPDSSLFQFSFREFDRVGTISLTPHTDSGDTPAPNLSGKYSMPSAVENGGLLVAYSTGSVNQTETFCRFLGGNTCEALKSGIYLMPNATGNESTVILDPATQLIKIKDDLNYNEIWPRAVLSYQQIFGQPTPDIIKNLATSLPDDPHLEPGEATALLGTSSMYNREINDGDRDPFNSGTSFREGNSGNWTIQGAEAGVFTNDDIYGVRIIATPPKPYTRAIDKFVDPVRWNSILRHIHDNRLEYVVARFGSDHGERWEILGEFPVKGKKTPEPDSVPIVDALGDPDTSWLAKIPADTPTFIQTIDKKGMTLTSEIAWRALKSGEKRADCGGCHAHSTLTSPLDFSTTEAGENNSITNIPGVDSTDNRVKDGIWDLTLNSIPLLNGTGVRFEPGYSYGVEFNQNIKPILNNHCVICHQPGTSGAVLNLKDDPWTAISRTGGYGDNSLQISKYIRTPQARQSLLVWAAWDERLDGRDNTTRGDDVDYSSAADLAHDDALMTISDDERRTIARWVDLGSPIDFPATDGMGYTDDYQLPAVNIYTPQRGDNSVTELKVGFADAKSGLNWSSLKVSYHVVGEATEQPVAINTGLDITAKNILTKNLGLSSGDYVLTVSVEDMVGNIGIATRRFQVN